MHKQRDVRLFVAHVEHHVGGLRGHAHVEGCLEVAHDGGGELRREAPPRRLPPRQKLEHL